MTVYDFSTIQMWSGLSSNPNGIAQGNGTRFGFWAFCPAVTLTHGKECNSNYESQTNQKSLLYPAALRSIVRGTSCVRDSRYVDHPAQYRVDDALPSNSRNGTGGTGKERLVLVAVADSHRFNTPEQDTGASYGVRERAERGFVMAVSCDSAAWL